MAYGVKRNLENILIINNRSIYKYQLGSISISVNTANGGNQPAKKINKRGEKK